MTSIAKPISAAPGVELPTADRGTAIWTVVVCCMAIFMAALDNLIVTTALPSIRTDLSAGFDSIQWTMNAYTLMFVMLLPIGTAIADRYGRKRLFLGGLALFTASSATAALAPGIGWLITARAVQGIGGAVMTPLTLTLIAAAMPVARRGVALGAWGAVSGLGFVLGPVFGGVIVEHASWAWIFWINVPFGMVLLILAGVFLRESRRPVPSLDVVGTVLVSAGLLGVVFGLIQGNKTGWADLGVSAELVGGTVLVGVFLWWENRCPAPILPLELFRSRGFSATNAVALLMGFGMYGVVFLLAQFLQIVQGYSPQQAGLLTLPWTGMPLIMAPIAGVLAGRVGSRILLIVGMLCQSLGLAWLALVLAPETAYRIMVPGFVLCGIGLGLFVTPLAALVLSFVEPELEGVASGTSTVLRLFGNVLGVSVLGAIFATAGGYGSPDEFVAGAVPAVWTGAALLAVAAGISVVIPRAAASR